MRTRTVRLVLMGAVVVSVQLSAGAAEAADPYVVESILVELDGQPNDAVVDVARGRVYVSVPSADEIVLVDLATGAILDRRFFPDPTGMDLSADGAFLYVALNGSTGVMRVDLSDWSTRQEVIPELGDPNTWDVVEIEAGVVLISADTSGFAYIVRYDFATDTATVVADGTIIRAGPRFAVDEGSFAYVGEGYSPNSLFKLDLNAAGLPIVLEDDHGGVGGAQSTAVSPGGQFLVLGGGQKLDPASYVSIGTYSQGVPVLSDSGDLVYVFSDRFSGPISIEVFAADTTQMLETWDAGCGAVGYGVARATKSEGSPVIAALPDRATTLCLVDSSTATPPPPKLPGTSPGCNAVNDPALDGMYHRYSNIYEVFYPGEVVTVTAGPPDTVTNSLSRVVLWPSPGGVGIQTQYPGTVRWVVPDTTSDPSYFSLFWEINDAPRYGPSDATWVVSCKVLHTLSGRVTDRHTGEPISDICVGVHPLGKPDQLVAEAVTAGTGLVSDIGTFSTFVPPGIYQVSYVECSRWDYAAEWYGVDKIEPVDASTGDAEASVTLTTGSMLGLVDMTQGFWALSAPRKDLVDGFFFGNPGDFPIVGDWDCDGVDTPGMYRQSDGYVYLRNSNTQGIADIRFFFGDPGDIPLAGDFNGDGCDTVSIFRPSAARVFIINELGQNDGGLGAADFTYLFGNPGDKPFVGDFDADGIDTVGLHRESTGLVYFRNSHTQGNADVQYIFGDPGDRLVAGNFSGFWEETPAVFRPSDLTFYIRHTNTQGNADRTETWDFTSPTWYPVAGVFGLSSGGFAAQSSSGQMERKTS
jgi:hypothetical protein